MVVVPVQLLHRFNDPMPEPVKRETRKERRERRAKKHKERYAKRLSIQQNKCSPLAACGVLRRAYVLCLLLSGDPKEVKEDKTEDAYKTLFVGRLVRLQ